MLTECLSQKQAGEGIIRDDTIPRVIYACETSIWRIYIHLIGETDHINIIGNEYKNWSLLRGSLWYHARVGDNNPTT